MPWPRAAQRVLIVLAAGLLALGVVGWKTSRRPAVVAAPDAPSLTVLLDLNSADAADLETLPGVGTSLAGRIEAYRSAHGPFRSVDDLRKIPGFGEKLAAALRPFVTVH
ncbi:MAG: ComEA family DNA-binding protein [Candidatus Methylomirabilia bacterium]